MTQKALKLALEALKAAQELAGKHEAELEYGFQQVITAIKEALAQLEQEPVAVYGYCPECGAKGVMRERRPNGNDKCANGHTYPSSKSTPPQPEQEPVKDWAASHNAICALLRQAHDALALTSYPMMHRWVGLTDEERSYYLQSASNVGWWQAAQFIEAKLKEKNCL